MKLKWVLFSAFFITVCFFLLAFAQTNSYFVISKKDVQFKIPKGFPKPVYTFANNKVTTEGFVLGRKLFYDPILSKDSSISCSFCHQRIAAFAHIDHTLSHGINGLIGKRNVPAIQNMIWQNSFMWDGGVNHIEVQPIAPITNSTEMDEKLANVVSKIQKNKEYVADFKTVFKDSIITSEKVLKVLAQFTGMMISCNSKYDKYVKGEEKFTQQEQSGLQLFRAKCTACHVEPLFTDNTFRNIGLKPDTALADSGRANITHLVADYMKFKVPSLRNVELTYPYMHDGRFRNLQQVLNHYATGNFFTTNVDSAVIKNVGLTTNERADLIAFLKTLTDREFVYDRRFADPNFHY